MMRVLQLGGPMGLFGAERWILALSRYLPADQVQTFVGAIQDVPGLGEPPLCVEARRLGLATVTFDAPGKLSRAAVPMLREFIGRQRIDVLHTHGYKTDILGVLATRGTGCRLLSTPHGWSVGAGFKVQLYEALDRLSFAWCDRIAPLSEDLMAGLQRLPWAAKRSQLIRNGVDLGEVTASDAVADEVAQIRRAGCAVVGYIGQLIARKRLDTLVAAIATLGTDVHLVLVGDGDARDALRDQAQALGVGDRVHFAGFRADRLDWLRGFDLFAMPSSLEGIPRCLMESMAARVPIVASDIEGNRALVVPGETGLLFPVGDVPALAAALGRLLGDRDLCRRMAESAFVRVNETFSAERMAREYLALYREMRGPARRAAPTALSSS